MVDRPDGLELSIEDDGRGFDPEVVSSDHLGLKIMNERSKEIGVQLEISSQSGAGTRVTALWKSK